MKAESTGWRDLDLPLRHRTWGDDVPAVDLDFVALEYNYLVPVALIDYKSGFSYAESARDRANFAALSKLASFYDGPRSEGPAPADGRGIPFIVVPYERRPWRFKIQPRNDVAHEILPLAATNTELSEERYVRFLYWLRGNGAPPPEVLALISQPEPTTTR